MSENSEQLIRWGILGCGDVTEVKSGPALMKAARSRVDCVMRRDGEKAADYASRHGVPCWTADANALINDPEIDAIYIATPPSSHADYAIAALEAGKHVLLEKPMALSTEECNAIEDAVESNGRKLSVAYYRRALPRFEKLRQIATDGTIGEVRLVEVRHFIPAQDRPAQSWKIDPRVGGGGYFVDTQTHTLDWLTYVFGVPSKVNGLKKQQAGNYGAEDLVSYLMDFERFPAVGLCVYSASNREEGVTIHGSSGKAHMGFFGPSAVTLSLGGDVKEIDKPDPAHVHQPFVEKVIAHFLGDAPNPCDARQGRQATELVERIFKGLSD